MTELKPRRNLVRQIGPSASYPQVQIQEQRAKAILLNLPPRGPEIKAKAQQVKTLDRTWEGIAREAETGRAKAKQPREARTAESGKALLPFA